MWEPKTIQELKEVALQKYSVYCHEHTMPKQKNKMKSILSKLYRAKNMSEKLMWQNVYFWYVRNYN